MAPCLKAFYAVFSVVIVSAVYAADEHRPRSEDIGPCVGCKAFAEGFEKGLQRTLNTARTTERLTDIMSDLCTDPRFQSKCLETADRAKPFVDEWWKLEDAPNFFQFICVDKLEVCCPKHHYGRECLVCQGWRAGEGEGEGDGEGEVCSGHGKCRGDGTRKGNGTCLCDMGYGGELCGDCLTGYYLVDKDSKWQCKKCDPSCTGGCHNGTPRDCVACRPGFLFDQEHGCRDINECIDAKRCSKDEYCINTMGSYMCMRCDEACKGCHGNGNDMCRKCAAGYSKKGEHCVREVVDHELNQMTGTRYMTYLGLLVAGGVLYPRAPGLAAGVGALTLSYIALAEYYCHASGHASLLDLPLLTI